MLTHADIVEKCLFFDKAPETVFFFMTTGDLTFKLGWISYTWSSLSEGERYTIIKNDSYFMSEEHVLKMIERVKKLRFEEI